MFFEGVLDLRPAAPTFGADAVLALVWMITSLNANFALVEGPPELADASAPGSADE